ncbi:hypothetical protein Ahy_B01g055254 [Arachis hypogaea]|uniref:Uncharacterized protein n=1 Tax=Arachis hypogaea TaxID=3818 RepID=A0A445AVU3_ARAHY|nr:hypothetical protein Ahy_B01g055254 [Arachis hypogaea]
MVFLHNLLKRFKWQALIIPHEKIDVDPSPVPANHLPLRGGCNDTQHFVMHFVSVPYYYGNLVKGKVRGANEIFV